MIEPIEGPRSVGNRSIRLVLADGGVVQFATWKPRSAIEALRSAGVGPPAS